MMIYHSTMLVVSATCCRTTWWFTILPCWLFQLRAAEPHDDLPFYHVDCFSYVLPNHMMIYHSTMLIVSATCCRTTWWFTILPCWLFQLRAAEPHDDLPFYHVGCFSYVLPNHMMIYHPFYHVDYFSYVLPNHIMIYHSTMLIVSATCCRTTWWFTILPCWLFQLRVAKSHNDLPFYHVDYFSYVLPNHIMIYHSTMLVVSATCCRTTWWFTILPCWLFQLRVAKPHDDLPFYHVDYFSYVLPNHMMIYHSTMLIISATCCQTTWWFTIHSTMLIVSAMCCQTT